MSRKRTGKTRGKMPSGRAVWRRPWAVLRSRDHKVIGLVFLLIAMGFGLVAGLLGLVIRYHQAWPDQDLPCAMAWPQDLSVTAPEPHPLRWVPGERLTLTAEHLFADRDFPADLGVELVGLLDDRLAARVPAGVRLRAADGGLMDPLDTPTTVYLARRDFGPGYHPDRIALATAAGAPMYLSPVPGDEVPRFTPGWMHLPLLTDQLMVRVQPLPGQNAPLPPGDRTLDLPASKLAASKRHLAPHAYPALTSFNRSVVLLLVAVPAMVGGFGVYLLPLLIGASNIAWPRLVRAAMHAYLVAGAILVSSLWWPGGPVRAGWLVESSRIQAGEEVATVAVMGWLVAMALLALAGGAIAASALWTLWHRRAQGMTWGRLPLTAWSLGFSAGLLGLVSVAGIFGLAWRTLEALGLGLGWAGGPMANGSQWGQAAWLVVNPLTWVALLPAMGMVSDVLCVHSRKPAFGYPVIVGSFGVLAVLSPLSWGHLVLQAELGPTLRLVVVATTMLSGVPLALLLFNWTMTLWGGSLRLRPALLAGLMFLVVVLVGGLSGLMLSVAPINLGWHATHLVTAHRHYLLTGGVLFGLLAGLYHWYPKLVGRGMDPAWGNAHLLASFVLFHATFGLLFVTGWVGHPAGYSTVMEVPSLRFLQPLSVVMTLCAFSLGLVQVVVLVNFLGHLPRRLAGWCLAVGLWALLVPVLAGGLRDAGLSSEGLPGVFGADGGLMAWDGPLRGVLATIVGLPLAVAGTWVLGWLTRSVPASPWWRGLAWLTFAVAMVGPPLLAADGYLFLGVSEFDHWRWLMPVVGLPLGLLFWRWAEELNPDELEGEVDHPSWRTNPYDANTLEWQTDSPPPPENFVLTPVVYRGPYEYNAPVTRRDFWPQNTPPGEAEMPPPTHDW